MDDATDNFRRQVVLPICYRLVACSAIIMLIGSGAALLMQNWQSGQRAAQASDVSVVGPPTLSATTVNAIFARVGSPMNGSGQLVETMSRQTGIDDAFALGVWWAESNDGMAGVGLSNRNPGSVRGSVGYPSDGDGYTIYPSYAAAISYWFNLLRSRYVDQGLSTVYAIARPYVGTTSYPLWAAKVINLMYEYRGMAPPPPAFVPTATPKPKPTVNPAVVAANAARQRKAVLIQQWQAHTGNFAYLFNEGISQEAPRQPVQPGADLPASVVDVIVIVGLLAALIIALYALLGLRGASQPSPSEHSETLPVAEHPQSMRQPETGAIPALSMLALPSRTPATVAPPRRIRLLPTMMADAEAEEQDSQLALMAAAAGVTEQTGGLLSRYGQIGQNFDL
jgi:hypothetical protein